MTRNTLMIDLNDPRAGRIAEVISNETCKKILLLLAEEELSESEISTRLKIPMNTVNYNVKKLVEAGLINASGKFLWSVKGKRIHKYSISNKKIVISPRAAPRGMLPVAIVSLIIAAGLKVWTNVAVSYGKVGAVASKGAEAAGGALEQSVSTGAGASSDSVMQAANAAPSAIAQNPESFYSGIFSYLANAPNSWAWFLIGALTALLLLILWSWRGRKNESE